MPQLLTSFLKTIGLTITFSAKDANGDGYNGQDIHCGALRIKYREANITPKKTGVFVALWKRGINGSTEPFQVSDPFDFYWIYAPHISRPGFFCFPKNILAENGVLTGAQKEGKRGFRLYPPWGETLNQQAQRAQRWQAPYFIEEREEAGSAAKLRQILSPKKHGSRGWNRTTVEGGKPLPVHSATRQNLYG